MIKRSATLALTLLYVVTVVGFVLNINYCCNRLTAVSLTNPDKPCSMLLTGKIKCCETRLVNVQVKDVHQHGPSVLLNRVCAFKLSKIPFFDKASVGYYKLLEAKSDKRPPPIPVSLIAAYTKNCIFLI